MVFNLVCVAQANSYSWSSIVLLEHSITSSMLLWCLYSNSQTNSILIIIQQGSSNISFTFIPNIGVHHIGEFCHFLVWFYCILIMDTWPARTRTTRWWPRALVQNRLHFWFWESAEVARHCLCRPSEVCNTTVLITYIAVRDGKKLSALLSTSRTQPTVCMLISV